MGVVNAADHNNTQEKLQQVILYFLEHINNVHLGRTKLMKLLYFVDFDHYEAHGVPVTGATYRKLPHGPYPDKIEKLIARMEKAGLVRRERDDHDRRKVFIATVPENVAKVGRFYEHMRLMILKDWETLSDADLRLLLRFMTQGYMTMLAATEQLRTMMETPQGKRTGATKPARAP